MRTTGTFILILSFSLQAVATTKQIAITIDDAPNFSSALFSSVDRTTTLISKLEKLGVPSPMVLANPCKQASGGPTLNQIRQYADAGFTIGNHTCSHPRLDDIGADAFIANIEQADLLLKPFVGSQKFFRFPFFNESVDLTVRNKVRSWLGEHGFKNTPVTIDDDDYVFAPKLNQAKKLGKKIDYKKVEALYVEHILSAAEFYDSLSRKLLGRSPKHTLLLHEIDSSVLFIEALVKAFRQKGWMFISATDAYSDPVYSEQPGSLTSGSGLITQLNEDRTGKIEKYDDGVGQKLDMLLGFNYSP